MRLLHQHALSLLQPHMLADTTLSLSKELPAETLTVLRCPAACVYCLQLKELKEELAGLRVAKVTGGAPNKLSKM